MPLFDAHLHIIDPRFPLVANQGYLPDPFTVADYHHGMQGLPLVGGAVVSGSFQGTDQRYLCAALQALGDGYVGVTQLPADVADDTLLALHDAGIRGVRFNLYRGGAVDMAALAGMAERIHALVGWHVELYADSATLADHVALLARLPRVSIDHLGLSAEGVPVLRQLAAAGVCVKASGFGRLSFDVAPVLRAIHRDNPQALMFGSDLPGTRAPRPFEPGDIRTIEQALGSDSAAVLCHNARRFYRLQ